LRESPGRAQGKNHQTTKRRLAPAPGEEEHPSGSRQEVKKEVKPGKLMNKAFRTMHGKSGVKVN